MRSLLLLGLLALGLSAQDNYQGVITRQSGYPAVEPTKHLFNTNGLVTYICFASPLQTPGNLFHTWRVSDLSLTSIVVNANVATVTTAAPHGLVTGNAVTVSGSTTAALNGVHYYITTTGTATFTFATSGVGNATFANAALAVTAEAPSEIDPVWSIEFFQYDANNAVTLPLWGYDVNNQGGAAGYNQICANRAVTTGATRIYYK